MSDVVGGLADFILSAPSFLAAYWKWVLILGAAGLAAGLVAFTWPLAGHTLPRALDDHALAEAHRERDGARHPWPGEPHTLEHIVAAVWDRHRLKLHGCTCGFRSTPDSHGAHLGAEVVKALDEAEKWETDLHCFTHGFQPGQICTQGCDIARVRRRVGPWERVPKGEA